MHLSHSERVEIKICRDSNLNPVSKTTKRCHLDVQKGIHLEQALPTFFSKEEHRRPPCH